jgi:hypothetical protein
MRESGPGLPGNGLGNEKMKSIPGPPMTLGNAAAARVRLIVWRKDCQHQVEPDPAEQARRYGAETSVLEWRRKLVDLPPEKWTPGYAYFASPGRAPDHNFHGSCLLRRFGPAIALVLRQRRGPRRRHRRFMKSEPGPPIHSAPPRLPACG